MKPVWLGVALALFSITAAAQDEPAVSGRLVGPDSKPVAGARIAIVPKPVPRISWEEEPIHALYLDAEADPRRVERVTSTDGTWRIPTRAHLVDIVAWKPGYAPAVVENWRTASGPVAMALGAGGRVRGVVRNLADQPIAGAELVHRAVVADFAHEIRARTDAAGNYDIAGLPEWPSMVDPLSASIEVLALGFAPQVRPMKLARREVPKEPSPATYELDVFLAKGATIEGKVTAHDGKLVANAEVLLWSGEALVDGGLDPRHRMLGYAEDLFGVRVPSKASTDAQGRYRLTQVPVAAGRASLGGRSRKKPEYPGGILVIGPDGAFEFGEVPWLDQDGAKREVDFTLPRSLSLRGVVRTGDGKPCPGAGLSVSIKRDPEDPRADRRSTLAYSLRELLAKRRCTDSTTADIAGNFEIRGLERPASPDAAMEIQVWLEEPHLVGDATVPIATDDAIHRDLVLRPPDYTRAPGHRGRVVDPSGKPIAGARVIVRSAEFPNRDGIPAQDEGVSDETGAFLLNRSGAVKGSTDFATVSARGYATKSYPFDGLSLDALEYRLERARSVTGRVVTADGKPVDRVRVFALDPAVPLAAACEVDLLEQIPKRWIAVAVTGPVGQFTLDDVPAGEIHLAAERVSGSSRDRSRNRFVIAKVGPTEGAGVEIILEAK
jgi:hypothetical protein